MPQFDTQFFASQIFWVCVCFGILWAAMHFWVVPSIQDIWEKRKGYVRDILEEAERLNGVSSDIRARCDAQHADLQTQLQNRVQSVSRHHEKIMALRMQELQQEFTSQMHKTKQELVLTQEKFTALMEQEALETARQLLMQHTQGKDHGNP